MTIEIEVSDVADLFAPNALFQLPMPTNAAQALAAIRFVAHADEGDSREAVRRACYDAAVQRIGDAYPALQLWLFACHSADQPRTKIVQHRRLWQSLATSQLVLPSGARTVESKVESGDGVRFLLLHRSL